MSEALSKLGKHLFNLQMDFGLASLCLQHRAQCLEAFAHGSSTHPVVLPQTFAQPRLPGTVEQLPGVSRAS